MLLQRALRCPQCQLAAKTHQPTASKQDGIWVQRHRQSLSPIQPRLLNNDAPCPHKKKVGMSPRHLFNTCEETNNLPSKLLCSGCTCHKDFGAKPREEHASEKCKCCKAWERDEKEVTKAQRCHFDGIMDFVTKQMQINPSALKREVVATPKPPPKPTEAADNGVTPSPPVRHCQSCKSKLNQLKRRFAAMGKSSLSTSLQHTGLFTEIT